MGLFKTLREDWARHAASASHRSFPALAVYRFGRWVREQPAPVTHVGERIYDAALLVSETVSGVYLDRDTEVGDALHLVHAGGIHIDPRAVIGNHVGIMQGVTIGSAEPGGPAPVIGDNVFIGAHASLIGGITVGAGARIAANTLVNVDVPEGALAIGVPAKIVPQLVSKKPKQASRGQPDEQSD